MAHDWLYTAYGQDDVQRYLVLAQQLISAGNLREAATAYDRAFGLAPENSAIASARHQLLDQLAVLENGITFRYIPAGTFIMGSAFGDPDELPLHPVQLGEYWLADTPMSWEMYCRLMEWEPPPIGLPRDHDRFDYESASEEERDRFVSLEGANKIRLQYCENETLRAGDWHAHIPDKLWNNGKEGQITSRELFGEVPREHPEHPWGYDRKPLVSVTWNDAVAVGSQMSTSAVTYRLPTEAEWEKAARGGLIDALYPWGNATPAPTRCDFDRFDQFSIQPMRAFPPNGYGLYAMSGCVWEWTADWYDAAYYESSPSLHPAGPPDGQERVLRGGSWADCADALRVSFRMSGGSLYSPTVGFRLCRIQR